MAIYIIIRTMIIAWLLKLIFSWESEAVRYYIVKCVYIAEISRFFQYLQNYLFKYYSNVFVIDKNFSFAHLAKWLRNNRYRDDFLQILYIKSIFSCCITLSKTSGSIFSRLSLSLSMSTVMQLVLDGVVEFHTEHDSWRDRPRRRFRARSPHPCETCLILPCHDEI